MAKDNTSAKQERIDLQAELREETRAMARLRSEMEDLRSKIHENNTKFKTFGSVMSELFGLKTQDISGPRKKLKKEIENLAREIAAQDSEIVALNKSAKKRREELDKQIKLEEDRVKLAEEQLAEAREMAKNENTSLEDKLAFEKAYVDQLEKANADFEAAKKKKEDLNEKLQKADNHRLELIEEQTAKEAELRKQVIDGLKKSASQISDGVGMIKRGLNELKNVFLSATEKYRIVDEQASKIARSIGMTSAEREDLRTTSIQFFGNNNISGRYNVKQEDFLQMNADLENQLGRKFNFATSNYENMAAAMSLFGPEKVVNMAAKLDSFGISYENSVKYTESLMKESEKTGLSFTKLSDTFLNNIKLAQTYSFKNGLEGLQNMARKATELKMDMQEVARLADKTNSIEGAVNTAANLQVLGGPFAQFADPTALLYGGLNDLESLQDRLISLTKSLGNFNKMTGQVEMTSFDLQRVKSAAGEMGMDPQKFVESINESAKREEIKKQAMAAGITNEEELEMIQNSGRLVNGVAKITDTQGNDLNISQLKKEDNWRQELKKINQDQSADIKQMASSVISFNEQMSGTVEQIQNKLAEGVDDLNVMNDVQELLLKFSEWITKNAGYFYAAAIAYFGIQTAAALGQIVKGGFSIGSGIVSGARWLGHAGAAGLSSLGGLLGFGSRTGGVAAEKTAEDLIGKRLTLNGTNYSIEAGKNGQLMVRGAKGRWVGQAERQAVLSAAKNGGAETAAAASGAKGLTMGARLARFGGGAALMTGGYLLDNYADSDMDVNGKGYAFAKQAGVPLLYGAGAGLMAASMFGGPVGWIVGGAVGTGMMIKNHNDVEKRRKQLIEEKYGALSGSTGWGMFGSSTYDNEDLGHMLRGDMDEELKETMRKNGDEAILKKIEKEHQKGLASDDEDEDSEVSKSEVGTMHVKTLNVETFNNGTSSDESGGKYWITPVGSDAERVKQGENGYNSMRVSPNSQNGQQTNINIPEIKVTVSGNISLNNDKNAKVLDKNAKEELVNMVKYSIMNEFAKQYGYGYNYRSSYSLTPAQGAVVSPKIN